MADLFEETERLKIRFLSAYQRLMELGHITPDEFDEVVDAVDRMDELSKEEFVEKLGKFARLGPKLDGKADTDDPHDSG